MITEYPYHLERKRSKSSKPNIHAKKREYNQLIERIENYINELIKNGKRGSVFYADIEKSLDIPSGFLGFECLIDGGHHGFTISEDVKYVD